MAILFDMKRRKNILKLHMQIVFDKSFSYKERHVSQHRQANANENKSVEFNLLVLLFATAIGQAFFHRSTR